MPQIPLLVVSFRQFLQVSALRPYSPPERKTLISHKVLKDSNKLTTTNLKSTWSTVTTTTVSDRRRSPSFWINEHVLGDCFRLCTQSRISHPKIKYGTCCTQPLKSVPTPSKCVSKPSKWVSITSMLFNDGKMFFGVELCVKARTLCYR